MQNVKNPILELSFEFAIEIIAYCEKLEAKRKYVIAHQLLKSGTSIGANIREAQHPHSRADFIAKYGYCFKGDQRNRILASTLPAKRKLSKYNGVTRQANRIKKTFI